MKTLLKICVSALLVIVSLQPTAEAAEIWRSDGSAASGSNESQFWVKVRSNTRARHAVNRGANPAAHRTGSARYRPVLLAASVCRTFQDIAPCGGTAPACSRNVAVKNGALYGGGRAPTTCTPAQPVAVAAGPAPLPQVTPGVVLTALRTIGLPAARARTQPETKTLVNFATNFYTRPQALTRTVVLLGQQVRIVATPAGYTWHYGDGRSSRTTGPGARYPRLVVTHRYQQAHTTVVTSVDVTYTARFTVGNGPSQVIPGAVTIAGPGAPLRVSEATAVLSGADH